MKKGFLKIMLMFLTLTTAVYGQSQESMIIEKTDGTTVEFDINDIKQMYFFKEKISDFGQVADAVDLGLSVDWASWNLGASSIGEYGGLYGWADPTGQLTSKNLSDYPSSTPPTDICGTDYDIAHVVWGEDWRLPSADEISELKEKCKWYIEPMNGKTCIKVVGPNGNHIILPLGGSRSGTEVQELDEIGRFISGTLYQDDNRYAHGLKITQESYGMIGFNRALGCSVRPVRSKADVPPANIIYREPHTEWGATMQETKNYMSGYELLQETTSQLAYAGKDKETLIVYMYDGGNLVTAGVFIEPSKTTLSEIGNQLINNYYVSLGEKENVSLYVSSDGKTLVSVQLDSDMGVYVVQYYDYEWFVGKDDSETIFEEPYVVWGTSRTVVKSQMAELGYVLDQESNQASEYYLLIYGGKHKEMMTACFFDDQKCLDQVYQAFYASTVAIDEIRNYLTSNLLYEYFGSNNANTQHYYLSKDGKTIAIVESDTLSNGQEVVYVTYISSASIAGARQISSAKSLQSISVDGASLKKLPEMQMDIYLKFIVNQVKKHNAQIQHFLK